MQVYAGGLLLLLWLLGSNAQKWCAVQAISSL
jgi:hypothetical protein